MTLLRAQLPQAQLRRSIVLLALIFGAWGCFPRDTLEAGPTGAGDAVSDVAGQLDVGSDGTSSGGTSSGGTSNGGDSTGTDSASSGGSGGDGFGGDGVQIVDGAQGGDGSTTLGDGAQIGGDGAQIGGDSVQVGDGSTTLGDGSTNIGDGSGSNGDGSGSNGDGNGSNGDGSGSDPKADVVTLPPAGCSTADDCEDPKLPCAAVICDATSKQCVVQPQNGGLCEDGDLCTANDSCAFGSCVAGPSSCSCATDADCAAKDDKNACNGVLWCDPVVKACRPKPGSVIACVDDGDLCTHVSCDSLTGKCAPTPLNNTACDDSNPCTSGDFCSVGVCGGTTTKCPCKGNADCADATIDPCTTKLLCDVISKTCVPVPTGKKQCPPDATECTLTACDAKSGACVTTPVPGICDDGQPCTGVDHCESGECVAGQPVCGCKQDADCTPLDDADLCNARLTCQAGQCHVDFTTVVTCVPHHTAACGATACDPLTGKCVLKPEKDGAACDDGDSCTTADQCSGGACVSTATKCTCSKLADCAQQNDADACNGTMYCDPISGGCKVDPASVVHCPDGGQCTVGGCDSKTGQCSSKPGNEGKSCDGAKACAKSQCQSGKCVATANCGCESHEECAAIGGNKCVPGFCDTAVLPWACKPLPGAAKTCNGAGLPVCKTRICDPKTGDCKLTNDTYGKACNDGNSCTANTSCDTGVCTKGSNKCECVLDGDCAGKNQSNKCLGTYYCHRANGKCQLDPATAVECDADKSGPCTSHVCDSKTAKCGFSNKPTTTTCNDNLPCTTKDHCDSGKCVGTNVCKCLSDAQCAGLNSSNKCNGIYFCDQTADVWTCKIDPSTATTCKPQNNPVCHDNKCDPKTGKCAFVAQVDGGKCDDGKSCTDNACKGSKCAVTKQLCQCLQHADCAKLDDGNLCNGSLYCDQSKVPYTCKASPKGAVKCDSVGNTSCLTNTCNPKSGVCGLTPVTGSVACDDGDDCTNADTCKGGKCSGNPGVCACLSDADCAAKDDGNACNGTLFCNSKSHVCETFPGTQIDCPPNLNSNTCLDYACDPKTGKCALTPVTKEKLCDDGNLCTTASGSFSDKCSGGTCGGGVNKCSCSKDADCSASDDGAPCNGKLFCKAGKCEVNPASVPNCEGDDDVMCARKVCNLNTGACITQKSDGKNCNDSQLCTENTFCKAGKCKSEVNVCKCQVNSDCNYLAANPCAKRPFCNREKAAPNYTCELLAGSEPFCSPANDTFCAANVCEPKTAKCAFGPRNNKKICDDNNPCIVNTSCGDGKCGGSSTNICICQKDADCVKQDNGDLCDGLMFCNQAQHKCELDLGTVVLCDQAASDQCLENICWPELGKCIVTPVENIKKEIFLSTGVVKKLPKTTAQYAFVSCDDGNACTANDQCKAGKCLVGGTTLCQCVTTQDCAAKDDGNACNGELYCTAKGECKANPATVPHCSKAEDTTCALNTCDPKTGSCGFQPVFGFNQACNDGDSCTTGDYCKDGKCESGTDTCVCKVNADCAKFTAGDKCARPHYCKVGKCVAHPGDQKVYCDPALNTECAANTCDKKTGACALSPVNQFGACDDGSPCTAGDFCNKGKCAVSVNLCVCEQDSDCDGLKSKSNCVAGLYCNRAKLGNKCSTDPRDVPICKGVVSGCKADACDKNTGKCALSTLPDTSACDDNNPCTGASFCASGSCKSGASLCNCKADVDCVGKGDHCSGPLYCDKSTSIAHCRSNPATQPFCPQPPAQQCKVAFCDAASKSCGTQIAADGTPCGGGKACAGGNCK